MSRSTSWCRYRIPACPPRSVTPSIPAWPFELGIIRNHYVGRTFIQPTQSVRELGRAHEAFGQPRRDRRQAHHPDRRFAGARQPRRRRSYAMMRDAGASEVHFRLASPPILYPDYYGIDLPDRGGLLAATHSLEEMREIIGADSTGVPVDRRHVPRDGRARPRSPPIRNSRTIALPASTRPTSPIRPRSNRSRGNCPCWRRRAESPVICRA